MFRDDGNDWVIGSSDDDQLYGGRGNDQLEGRDGIDTFAWSDPAEGRDTIIDFAVAVDRVNLDTVLVGFDGSETELVQFVRIVPTIDGRAGLLQVDADGLGAATGWGIWPSCRDRRNWPRWRYGALATC